MREFTDSKGRVWRLNFTGGNAIQFRRELGVDVEKLVAGDDGEIEKILSSSFRIFELLIPLLSSQIEAAGMMTPLPGKDNFRPSDDFYEGFGGDVLDRASVAFLLAVCDSLPKLQREALQAMIAKIFPAIDSMSQKVVKKIQSMPIEEEIAKAFP